jgi:hypothetical protein
MRLAGRIAVACLLSVLLAAVAFAGTGTLPPPGKGTKGILWVDLVPGVQAFQDQQRTHEIPSNPGAVKAVPFVKPNQGVWFKFWVKNNGNLPSGPFKARVWIKRGPGNASDQAIMDYSTPLTLDTEIAVSSLAPGETREVGTGTPRELLPNEPTTKFIAGIFADPTAGGGSEDGVQYGQVKEKKGTKWMEDNNNPRFVYIVKKP